MKKIYIDDRQLKSYVATLARQITISRWRPDYIVGLTRGGLIPATMLSHWLQVPMHTLNVSLRDDSGMGPESNLWMAEDAFGYPKAERFVENENDIGAVLDAAGSLLEQGDTSKNILIVDDINDSGATFNWIKDDWQSGCLPNDPDWEHVWHNNVRFAVVVNNDASHFKNVDYSAININKAEEDSWIVFPWENWWE